MPEGKKTTGYRGRWAFVDLTRTDRQGRARDPAFCPRLCRRPGPPGPPPGRPSRERRGPLKDPLCARTTGSSSAPPPLNDTAVATAGRGSCSFVGTMARSPEPGAWIPGHKPLFGLVTHSSAGGLFPNMLKRAGFDQHHHRRPGGPSGPHRGRRRRLPHRRRRGRSLRDDPGPAACRATASAITDTLTAGLKGSSTLTVGPAGWNLVDFACLTADRHRNFGRGGGRRRLRLEEPRRRHRVRRATPSSTPTRRRSAAWPGARRPDQGRASTTRPGRPRSARRRARPGGSTAPSTAATWASRAAICPGTISTRAPSTPRITTRSRRTPSWPSPRSTTSATSAATSSAPAVPGSRPARTRAKASGRSSRRSPCGSTAASSIATPSST